MVVYINLRIHTQSSYFSWQWETKPRRGKQRKAWGGVVDDAFLCLGLDKHEWVEDIKRGESSLASFLRRVLVRGLRKD